MIILRNKTKIENVMAIKIRFLASLILLVSLQHMARAEATSNKASASSSEQVIIDGITNFLADRAQANAAYIFELELLRHENLACYMPATFQKVKQLGLINLLQANNKPWRDSIWDDIEFNMLVELSKQVPSDVLNDDVKLQESAKRIAYMLYRALQLKAARDFFLNSVTLDEPSLRTIVDALVNDIESDLAKLSWIANSDFNNYLASSGNYCINNSRYTEIKTRNNFHYQRYEKEAIQPSSIREKNQYVILTPGSTDFTKLGAKDCKAGTLFTAQTGLKPGTAIPVSGALAPASSVVKGNQYVILTLGSTDFTKLGANDSKVGTVFTATDNGSNLGMVIPASGTQAIATSIVKWRQYVILTSGATDFTKLGAKDSIAGTVFTATDNGSNLGMVTPASGGAPAPASSIEKDKQYVILIPGATDFTKLGAKDSNVGTVFTATDNGSNLGTVIPASGTQATATSIVQGSQYVILTPGSIDFTKLGANDSKVGTVFTATDNGSNLGMVIPASGTETTATSIVKGSQYVILTTGATDFTKLGAKDSIAGTVFTATDDGQNQGMVILADSKREITQGGQYVILVTSTEFTDLGAQNNNVGTTFTALKKASLTTGRVMKSITDLSEFLNKISEQLNTCINNQPPCSNTSIRNMEPYEYKIAHWLAFIKSGNYVNVETELFTELIQPYQNQLQELSNAIDDSEKHKVEINQYTINKAKQFIKGEIPNAASMTAKDIQEKLEEQVSDMKKTSSYALFFSQLAESKTSTEVTTTLQNFMMPPVSFGELRENEHWSIASYVGLSATRARSGVQTAGGIFAPIGLQKSWPCPMNKFKGPFSGSFWDHPIDSWISDVASLQPCSKGGSLGVMLSPFDFGYPLSLKASGTNTTVTWGDVISPSIAIAWGIKEVPVNWGFALQRINKSLNNPNSSSRVLFFFSLDMPLYLIH